MRFGFNLGGAGTNITSAQEALSNHAELARMMRNAQQGSLEAEKDACSNPMPLESYRLAAMGAEGHNALMSRAAAVSYDVAALLVPQTTELSL